MNANELLDALLKTDKANTVRDLIAEFEESADGIGWRKVGDRSNNEGTIQAAGDPARALVERITNGLDAVIDRAHGEHQGRPECRSPKEAASAWFGIPPKGLHGLSTAAARGVAQNAVTITLMEGDGRARRALEIADFGKGLTGIQMPQTILSLNADNKVAKFYLAGAFGQGGSATFASSVYTLIVSRPIEAPNSTFFSVVRYEAPVGLKVGSYVYLVQNGEVLEAAIPQEYGSYATRIRHYGYDLEEYPNPLGQRSLYGRLQGILFDPALPFWFDNQVHKYRRTIKGSRTALNGAPEDDADGPKLSHSAAQFFSDLGEFGQVGIEYWVLAADAKGAPNKAFVNGQRPVVLTVNGQTHAEWPASLIRKEAELVHLTPRMVVHLDCNKLTPDAKRVLFVSNREESRKGLLQSLIAKDLVQALKTDDVLATLEEEARLAGTKARDEQAEKEIRREVAKVLKLFGFSVADDVGGATKGSGDKSDRTAQGKGGRPKPVPIELHEPPTMVEIVGDEPIGFYPGQRRFLRIRTDAHSQHHDAANPSKSSFSFMASGIEIRPAGSSELRDGHLRAVFAASLEAKVGDELQLSVEVRPIGAPTIRATKRAVIVEPPPPKPAGAKVNLPKINIQPIESKESEDWNTWNFGDDEAAVAADYTYAKGKDLLDIRYSAIFPRFKATLKDLSQKDAAQGASFQKRFEIWLTTAVLIHWQDYESDATKVSDESIAEDQLEDYRRDELRRLVKLSIVYAQREAARGQRGDLDD